MGKKSALCFAVFVFDGEKLHNDFSQNTTSTRNYSVIEYIGMNYARKGVCR